jgi:hypothetical protein
MRLILGFTGKLVVDGLCREGFFIFMGAFLTFDLTILFSSLLMAYSNSPSAEGRLAAIWLGLGIAILVMGAVSLPITIVAGLRQSIAEFRGQQLKITEPESGREEEEQRGEHAFKRTQRIMGRKEGPHPCVEPK